MDSSTVSFIITVLLNFIQIYSVLLIIRILLTWFQSQDWAYQAISFLSPITDPYLNLFRFSFMILGGIDFSPFLAFIVLNLVQQLLVSVSYTAMT